MNQSFFGHLVFRFGKGQENLGTEALSFILNRSHAANGAFIRLLSQLEAKMPQTLKFETQVAGQDGAIPDFVGSDIDGKTVVIGEVKFWAGLTNNQPITYLKRISKAPGAILLFIAPSKRIPTLWRELLHRCCEATLTISESLNMPTGIKMAVIGEETLMALVSWQAIINVMLSAAQAEGDIDATSDIKQLKGLCDRMDEIAFLPVQSEELTSDIGTRILQYSDLVDKLLDLLVTSRGASTKNLNKAHWKGVYLASMIIQKHIYQIQFNSHYWQKYGMTPLWLVIRRVGTDKDGSFAAEAKKRLVRLEMETPSRLYQLDNQLLIPLFIPTGVEQSNVIDYLQKQTHEVIDILADVDE